VPHRVRAAFRHPNFRLFMTARFLPIEPSEIRLSIHNPNLV
jgi:hypothetical protein